MSSADVAAAVEELSRARPADLEKPVERPASRWSKQELVANSLFLVVVTYWLLPAAAQQQLSGVGGLLQAIEAVVALFRL